MTTDIERGGMDVSGPHEPSYYEIALTNRQVVVAFVILLICVVAAFLSGVWIGRESATRAQEKLALLSRAAAPGDGAAGDREKPEGQALQEFKFFADPRRRQEKEKTGRSKASGLRVMPISSSPETASPRDTTPAPARAPAASSAPGPARAPASSSAPPAGTARSSPASTSRSSAAGRSAAAARPAPAEAPGEGEDAPPTPRRRPDEPARPRSSADTGSAAARAGAAASGPRVAPASMAAAGEVVIQVFSSADRDQADKVRDRLVSSGLTAFLSPIAKNGQTMYRVRIGPFPSRPAAETVAEKVRKEHKLDTWITPK